MPTSSPESAAPRARSWLSPDKTRLLRADVAIAKIATQNATLLDVRAPAEFACGAAPLAVNIPLLSDSERERVGIEYKQSGKHAAIDLGEALVRPERDARVAKWRAWAEGEREAILYCARGGMRSAIAQNWLTEAKVEVKRVEHGYKALRREMLATLARPYDFLVLGGFTGSAKTHFLRELEKNSLLIGRVFLDLEKIANHRGSAFGKPLKGMQPSAQNFENMLAMETLRRPRGVPILIEDESKTIGRVRIPNMYYDHVTRGKHVLLELPFSERVEYIYSAYVADPIREFGRETVFDFLRKSLSGIRDKLGDELFRKVSALVEIAGSTDAADRHRDWISLLLRHYYDPMYAYAMKRKNRTVLFRGSPAAVREFLLDFYSRY